MNSTSIKALAVISLLAISSPSLADPCDAYFNFDGTLTDGSSNGYDGEMIMKGGEPATPGYTDGKFGQALALNGTAAMRTLLDLNYDLCPQVTISAWIKVARDADASGDNLHLFSTGGGASPGLIVSGTSLHLHGTENGILNPDVLRKGSWLFVAGVYDYLKNEYALYSGGSTPVPGVLSPYRADPQNAFWVGTVHDDWGTFASGIAIDELKITGRALSSDQIARLRSASPAPNGQLSTAAAEPTPIASTLPACDVQADCATGSYCAFDNSCHPDSHMPKRELELTVLEGDPGIDASNVILGEGARSETELPLSDLGEDYFYGDWCFHPNSALPYGMDQIRSFNFAATKTGPASYSLAYEFRDSPGVTGGTGFWAWGIDVTDRLIVVWAFENSGEVIQDLKVTRATQQRFFAALEQDSGRATFVRGQCNTSEDFAPESIEANYFVGPWCITDSALAGEPSRPNWRYLFHASGSMSRNPGDGHDYRWNWRQQTERLELSDDGISTSRSIRSVSADSFQWGTPESRTYVRGQCPN